MDFDPFQAMITAIVAGSACLYPVGFLLGLCSNCCSCPVEEFNRCLRWRRLTPVLPNPELPQEFYYTPALPPRLISQKVATHEEAGLLYVPTLISYSGSIYLRDEAGALCANEDVEEEVLIYMPPKGSATEQMDVAKWKLKIIGQGVPPRRPPHLQYTPFWIDIDDTTIDIWLYEAWTDSPGSRVDSFGVGYIQVVDAYVVDKPDFLDGRVVTRSRLMGLLTVDPDTATSKSPTLVLQRLPLADLYHVPFSNSESVIVRYVLRMNRCGLRTHFTVDVMLGGQGYRFPRPAVLVWANTTPQALPVVGNEVRTGAFGAMPDRYVRWAPGFHVEVFDAYVELGNQYLDGSIVTRDLLRSLFTATPRAYPADYSGIIDYQWLGHPSAFRTLAASPGAARLAYVLRASNDGETYVYWTVLVDVVGGGEAASGLTPPSITPLDHPPNPTSIYPVPPPTEELRDWVAEDTRQEEMPPVVDQAAKTITVGGAYKSGLPESERIIALPAGQYVPTGQYLKKPFGGSLKPGGTYWKKNYYAEEFVDWGYILTHLKRRELGRNELFGGNGYFGYGWQWLGVDVNEILDPGIIARYVDGQPITVQIAGYEEQICEWELTATPPTDYCAVDLCPSTQTLLRNDPPTVDTPPLPNANQFKQVTLMAASPLPRRITCTIPPPEPYQVDFDGTTIPDGCGTEGHTMAASINEDCRYTGSYTTCSVGSGPCYVMGLGTIYDAAECEAMNGTGHMSPRHVSLECGFEAFYDADMLGVLDEGGPARTSVSINNIVYSISDDPGGIPEVYGCLTRTDSNVEFPYSALDLEGIAYYNTHGGCPDAGEGTLSVPGIPVESPPDPWEPNYQCAADDALVAGDYVSITSTVGCNGGYWYFEGRTNHGHYAYYSVAAHRYRWCESFNLVLVYPSTRYNILAGGCSDDREVVTTCCVTGKPHVYPDCKSHGFSFTPGSGSVVNLGSGIVEYPADVVNETTTGPLAFIWGNPALTGTMPYPTPILTSPTRKDVEIIVEPTADFYYEQTDVLGYYPGAGVLEYVRVNAQRPSVLVDGTDGCNIATANPGAQESSWDGNEGLYSWSSYTSITGIRVNTNECVYIRFRSNYTGFWWITGGDGGDKCDVTYTKTGDDFFNITIAEEGTVAILQAREYDRTDCEDNVAYVTFYGGGRAAPHTILVRQYNEC